MSRVTILMPVYNGEEFLRETMESVLKQSFADFIFLIINDGSTDETEQIILSFADSRIHYLKNDTNLGLVKTLNKGIELVETEFLARMDADDLWVETKLEKQIALLDNRPDVGICGTSIRKFGAFEGDFFFPVENAGLKAGFLFFCCMSHPSVVFRMSFLHETGLRYREDYFPAEDYKMWVESLKFTQIYNIPEKLVFYRQHENQITQDANSAQAILTNKVRLELLEELSVNFTEEEKSFHLNGYIYTVIRSTTDYRKLARWTNTLLQCNKKNAFVFPEPQFKQTLTKQVQGGYYGYVKQKYFSGSHTLGMLNYLVSLDWVYLRMKLSLKLLLGM